MPNSSNTEKQYLDLASRVIKFFNTENNNDPASIPDAEPFLSWHNSVRRKELSYNSLRLEKKALSFWAEKNEHKALLSVIETIVVSREGVSTAAKTSANRKKSISIKDIDKLREHVSQYNGIRLRQGLLILKCTMHTGLRADEWTDCSTFLSQPHSELNPSDRPRLMLKARNSKFREEDSPSLTRAFGPYRVLDIDDIPDDVKSQIDEIIAFFANPVSIYDLKKQAEDCSYQPKPYTKSKMLRSIQVALTNANAEIFGNQKHVTLHSARHQFIANLKKDEVDPIERCALLGHKSPDTAVRHYGKKAHGRSTSSKRPIATQPDIDQVIDLAISQNVIKESLINQLGYFVKSTTAPSGPK